MERHVPLVGNRLAVLENPRSCRARFMRSAESSRSWTVKAWSKPIKSEYSRKSRAPMPWNVPAQVRASIITPALSPIAFRDIRSTRFVISAAARRENVMSRIRRGSAPLTMRWATRCARVLVLPEPAPAMTKSGPPEAQFPSETPCSTARRCSALRVSRWADARGMIESFCVWTLTISDFWGVRNYAEDGRCRFYRCYSSGMRSATAQDWPSQTLLAPLSHLGGTGSVLVGDQSGAAAARPLDV